MPAQKVWTFMRAVSAGYRISPVLARGSMIWWWRCIGRPGHIPLFRFCFYDGANITAGCRLFDPADRYGTAFDIARREKQNLRAWPVDQTGNATGIIPCYERTTPSDPHCGVSENHTRKLR